MGDQVLLWNIAIIAAYLLGFVIGLLILYMVIRTAVSHALRSHSRWVQDGMP